MTNATTESEAMCITDMNAVIALISDAIDDSLGPDWTSFDAAHHVMQWLTDAGVTMVPTTWIARMADLEAERQGHLDAITNLGAVIGRLRKRTIPECAHSPDGRHHVDTSMESGPNNCFHCERTM